MRQLVAGLTLAGSALLFALAASNASGADSPSPPGDGRAIFTSNCAGCHGNDLVGARGPSLFGVRLFARLDDADLHDVITKGVKDSEMPPFGGSLNAEQIDAVIQYLHDRSAVLNAGPAPLVAAPIGRIGAPASQSVVGAAPDPNGQRIHSLSQDIQLETVVDDLDTPYGLDFLPDGRLLVSERTPVGNLRLIDPMGKEPPVRIAGLPDIHQGQDAGLLDVAVGPNYAADGWIYLAYSESDTTLPEPPPVAPGAKRARAPRKPSMTVIVRGKIDTNRRWTNQQLIFRAPSNVYTISGSHYGARILFDGKGHLFFSIGERGDMTNAQNLGTPLGKIHRINLDGSIPADNPFVKTAGAMPSIWSYGHRNPEGLAIEPVTGLLWESEHGPVGGDEINVIEPGKNYGWGVVSKGKQPGIRDVSAIGMVEPVAWYFPTIAPSGISFYNGTNYAGWQGSLFVAGLRGHQLRRLSVSKGKVVQQEIIFSELGRVRDVATGPDGLLYLLMTDPTGPGWNINYTNAVRGRLVRLKPIIWR